MQLRSIILNQFVQPPSGGEPPMGSISTQHGQKYLCLQLFLLQIMICTLQGRIKTMYLINNMKVQTDPLPLYITFVAICDGQVYDVGVGAELLHQPLATLLIRTQNSCFGSLMLESVICFRHWKGRHLFTLQVLVGPEELLDYIFLLWPRTCLGDIFFFFAKSNKILIPSNGLKKQS